MEQKSAIELAIEKFGVRGLARRMNVWPQAVAKWRKASSVPADRIVQLEAATGIGREHWRPDLYADRSTTSASNDAA